MLVHTALQQVQTVPCTQVSSLSQWRSKGGASGGTRPGAQALEAH